MNRNNQFFIDQIRALALADINIGDATDIDILEIKYYFESENSVETVVTAVKDGKVINEQQRWFTIEKFVKLDKQMRQMGMLTIDDLTVDEIYSKIGVLKPRPGTKAKDEIAHVMRDWKVYSTSHFQITRTEIDCQCGRYGIHFSYH